MSAATVAMATPETAGPTHRRAVPSSEIKPVVANYVKYRSTPSDRRRHERVPSDSDVIDGATDDDEDCPDAATDADPDVNGVIRIMAREFEERYSQVFRQTCGDIFLTPSNGQTIFMTAVRSLFEDGVINWGRVVALLAFSGSVAAQCIEKEMPFLVNQVIDWTSTFIAGNLASWMHDNGSWDGLVKFYVNGRDHKNGVSAWPSLSTLCTAAFGAISMLTLGALLVQK